MIANGIGYLSPYADHLDLDPRRVELEGLTEEESAAIAWRFLDVEREMLERLLMKKLRQYRGGLNEMFSEAAIKTPALIRSYRPDRGTTLRTHIFIGINWYLFKLFAHSSAGQWGIAHAGKTHAKKRRHAEIPEGHVAPVAADPSLLNDEVQCALSGLDAYSRSLLIMRFVCEMTLEEVGDVLGLTKSIAREHVERALNVARATAPTDVQASDEVLELMADLRRGLREDGTGTVDDQRSVSRMQQRDDA